MRRGLSGYYSSSPASKLLGVENGEDIILQPTRNMTQHRHPIEGGLASETPLFEKDSTQYFYKDASVVYLALCCKLLFYDIIMPGFSVLLNFI